MSNITDKALITFSGPQRGGGITKELYMITSVSPSHSKAQNKVYTMNPEGRAVGYQQGPEDSNMTLEVVHEKENPEIDWFYIWDNNLEFSLTIEQGDGGDRRQYLQCRVGDISDSYSAEGEVTKSVEVMCLYSVRIP
jgi:hypothetical protein